MTNINAASFVWPVSEALIAILQEAVMECAGTVIVNFRDPQYSPSSGGWHPVEIMIGKHGEINYIIDYSYVGKKPFEELSPELDFDFSTGKFRHLGREFTLSKGKELFRIWQNNFCSYHRMGVYQTTVEEI